MIVLLNINELLIRLSAYRGGNGHLIFNCTAGCCSYCIEFYWFM